ncbi:MAG: RNA methyltransferase [Bryobacteraceae bacterium]|nr:RNA methyltransferase [Bryobacteraceae bacterium]
MAEVRELGAHHPLLKEIRRAALKGTLTTDGCAIAESFHLLEEAHRAGLAIRAVVATRSAVDRAAAWHDLLSLVPDSVFAGLATTEHSQGVLALVRLPAFSPNDLGSLNVLLDGVQDPGNAGAIVRAAEAFGASAIAALRGTVSFANPKALRASAGSCFRLPMLAGLTLEELRPRLGTIYAAVAHDGTPIGEIDWTAPCTLAIGSEAHGVSKDLLAVATPVRIPTLAVESLNAAVAAGVILYEARRQRGVPA